MNNTVKFSLIGLALVGAYFLFKKKKSTGATGATSEEGGGGGGVGGGGIIGTVSSSLGLPVVMATPAILGGGQSTPNATTSGAPSTFNAPSTSSTASGPSISSVSSPSTTTTTSPSITTVSTTPSVTTEGSVASESVVPKPLTTIEEVKAPTASFLGFTGNRGYKGFADKRSIWAN